MDNLELVLTRLIDNDFKINGRKCKIFTSELRYVGYLIKAGEGLAIDPEKFAVIRALKHPTNCTQIKQVLAFFNYYRDSISDFAALARPLIQLTKKGVK